MPQLLWWGTLSPQGESNLAALRFEKPMRISSIRIFPKDAQPFKEVPDVVSETHPDAFFLDIYFNAQYMSTGAPPPGQQRAPNALVPTRLAYVGSEADFQVDMGSEYATRLMLVKGTYDAVSLAIYGEVVVKEEEKEMEEPRYEPKVLHVDEPMPLSNALDLANSPEPTRLANQLLSIASEGVDLSLAARLIFCFKPPDEYWDDPDFPHLYADLENTDDDFDLESVVSSVKKRPVQDSVAPESYAVLANRVNDFIGPKDSNQAYSFAELLSICAPQHPDMARTVIEQISMDTVFDATTLENHETMSWMLDACTNRDVATHIIEDQPLFDSFESLAKDDKVDAGIRATATRVMERVNGWKVFQKCLSNDGQDYAGAVRFLKDVLSEENSTGIWLSCMVLNSDLYDALVNIDSATSTLPPPLFRNESLVVSHAEFLAFVRALVGVLGVLTAWAWADSVPYDAYRERALAIINVWQSVNGYDNIVNQLLQLRQLTKRLGWIIEDNDPPRKSGMLAERVLSKLAEDPDANLRPPFIETVLKLQEPLYVISENDRLALRKTALVAQDGLAAAVEEILYTSQQPLSLRRLRTLRVSAVIIQKEIEGEEGELPVLQSFWEGDAHGLVARLVELLVDTADDVSKHFELQNVNKVDHTQVSVLFETATDLLRLIEVMVDSHPLTSRSLHSLTSAMADLFTCADSTSTVFAQGSDACISGSVARQASLDILQVLVGPGVSTETGGLAALTVFRALLVHAASTDEHDPIHKLLQVFAIIDHLLPYPHDEDMEVSEPSYWVTSVLPKSLHDLTTFFKLLDLDNRLHLFRRLVTLDAGVIGIGEWLMGEEMKGWLETLRELERLGLTEEYHLVLQHQVVESIEFTLDIIKPESALSTWYFSSVPSDPELSNLLNKVLEAILEGHYFSLPLSRLVQSLATKSDELESDLRLSILLLLLRNAQVDPTLTGTLDSLLPIICSLPTDAIDADTFTLELGLTLASYTAHSTTLERGAANILIQTLQWCLEQEVPLYHTLRGLKPEDFESLCDSLLTSNPEKESAISDIRTKISFDEDEVFSVPPIELPTERPQLLLSALQALLEPQEEIERPSTPRAGNKTPDILGTIISPPTAVLRSPAATGLTKKYTNDDFRQLRQVPSARLNTSRLPSMHGASALWMPGGNRN